MPFGDTCAASRAPSDHPASHESTSVIGSETKLHDYEIAVDDAAAAGIVNAAMGTAVVPYAAA